MSFLKQKVKLASTSSFRLVASLLVYMCVFFLFLMVYPLESIGGNKKYQISGSESSKQRRHGGRVGTGIQGEKSKVRRIPPDPSAFNTQNRWSFWRANFSQFE